MEALALRIMHDLPGSVRRLSIDLSSEQLSARPAAGAWSFVEVAGHLVDKTEAWGERFHRIAAEELPMLPAYDQDQRVRERNYQAQPFGAVSARLGAVIAALVADLKALPADAWGRAGVHAERGRLTLGEAVRIYAVSLPQHVEQMVSTRDAVLRLTRRQARQG